MQDRVLQRELAMPSTNIMVETVTLAAVILPACPIWRIQRRYISIPVAVLLSWWLLFIAGVIPLTLEPDYDGIGAAMTLAFAPGVAVGCALLLVVIRTGTRRRTSARPRRRRTVTGLTVWAGLGLFCIVASFIVPPRMRKGEPPLLTDYLFFCGPILLLAVTMSLAYLWQLLHPQREPDLSEADAPNQLSEAEQRRSDTSKLAIASIVLGVFSFGFGPLTGLPGLLVGQWARSRFLRQEDSSGRRAAEVGMVICLVAMVLWGLCLGYEYLSGGIMIGLDPQ